MTSVQTLFQYVTAQRFARGARFLLGSKPRLSGTVAKPAAGLVGYYTCMEFFDGKHKIPILSPYNIAILNIKTAELAFIKILIILRMRVTTDEVTYINRLPGIIAKPKVYRQVAGVHGIYNIKTTHSCLFKSSSELSPGGSTGRRTFRRRFEACGLYPP